VRAKPVIQMNFRVINFVDWVWGNVKRYDCKRDCLNDFATINNYWFQWMIAELSSVVAEIRPRLWFKCLISGWYFAKEWEAQHHVWSFVWICRVFCSFDYPVRRSFSYPSFVLWDPFLNKDDWCCSFFVMAGVSSTLLMLQFLRDGWSIFNKA